MAWLSRRLVGSVARVEDGTGTAEMKRGARLEGGVSNSQNKNQVVALILRSAGGVGSGGLGSRGLRRDVGSGLKVFWKRDQNFYLRLRQSVYFHQRRDEPRSNGNEVPEDVGG